MEWADFVGAAAQANECDSKRIVRSAFQRREHRREPAAAPAAAVAEDHRHVVRCCPARWRLLRGAALLRPMLPYAPEQAPAIAATDVLIDAGESDPNFSREQTRRLTDILRSDGAKVMVHGEPRPGDKVTRTDLAQTAGWDGRPHRAGV
jgi:hypothetical protein